MGGVMKAFISILLIPLLSCLISASELEANKAQIIENYGKIPLNSIALANFEIAIMYAAVRRVTFFSLDKL